MKRRAFLFVFFFLPPFFLGRAASAIGPRNVTNSGNAVRWSSMPVSVHLESDFDVRGKDVTALVNEALSTWQDLSESDVTFSSEALGVAVDDSNVCTYVFDSSACPSGPTDDGTNPLTIDDDGEITADFFGQANQFITLGFASIVTSQSSSGAAIKGEAVFNASCLTGVELAGCLAIGLSFSDDDFISFIVHELGHFLGLDHSQVNLTEATDNDDSNNNLITTMFPTFIVGNGASFKTPERDDKVGLAQLYPSNSFSSSFWSLSGKVYTSGGTTELQCANLVARNAADPKVETIAALSGDFATAGSDSGSYEILGLTPGASYTIDLESIASGFTGASGYTPCRGSSGESAPPSFTSLTSGSSFSGSAGESVTVTCTVGSDCTLGSSSATTTTTSSSGGCSLIP